MSTSTPGLLNPRPPGTVRAPIVREQFTLRTLSRPTDPDLTYCGRFISAATAVDWGLINEALQEGELDAAIERKTAEIAAKSRVAIRYGKQMFYRQQQLGLGAAYDYERRPVWTS